jgi:hypothetical protein
MIAKSNERGKIAINEGKHNMPSCDCASQYALRSSGSYQPVVEEIRKYLCLRISWYYCNGSWAFQAYKCNLQMLSKA